MYKAASRFVNRQTGKNVWVRRSAKRHNLVKTAPEEYTCNNCSGVYNFAGSEFSNFVNSSWCGGNREGDAANAVLETISKMNETEQAIIRYKLLSNEK